jgi:short-subunit dehydrogenase
MKRALITGATSGIGRATAHCFIRNQIEVGILAENPAQVEETVEALRSEGGRAFAVPVDLSKPHQVEGLISQIEAQHGPLDLLVNNAGLGLQGDVAETHQGDVRLLFEINFFSMVTLSRDAFLRMAERGRGHIINVSSASAKRALPGLSIYASTKAAMHAFSQALRIEGKGVGVDVTEVLPLSVQTPFFQNAFNRSDKSYVVGKWSITPEELAERILQAVHRPAPEIYTSALARIAFALDSLSPRWLDAILVHRRETSLTPQKVRSA